MALVGEGSDLLGVVAHPGYVLGDLAQRPFPAARLIPGSRPGRRVTEQYHRASRLCREHTSS
jgi:hypothetical protein